MSYHKTKLIIAVNMDQYMPSIGNILTYDGIEEPIRTDTNIVDYELEAFQCHSNNTKIVSPSALVQGSVLRVCIKSNDNDVYPVNINSLTLSRDSDVVATPINATFASFVTETACNSRVCYVKTIIEGLIV